MLLIGSSKDPIETYPLLPPKENQSPPETQVFFPLPPADNGNLPEAQIFYPLPQASLIPSPIKRGRTIDAKQRAKRRRTTANLTGANQSSAEGCISASEPLQASESFSGDSPESPGLAFGENRSTNPQFEEYVDAVLSETAGFIQISSDLYVVQGWDTRRSEITVSYKFNYGVPTELLLMLWIIEYVVSPPIRHS